MILDHLKRAWEGRSRRERLLMAAAGLLAVACLATAGQQSLSRWRLAAAERLSSASSEHQAIVKELARLRPTDASGAPPDRALLEQSARRAAQTAGLAVTLQSTPEGVAFAVEEAPATAVLGWLSALEAEGAAAVALDLERTEIGGVRAQGTLAPRSDPRD